MEQIYDRKELLSYPLSKSDAIKLQNKWMVFIQNENAPEITLNEIETIVGIDLTYLKNKSDEYGIGCAVLWDVEKKREICHEFAIDKVDFPYISGLLAFRELPIAAMAINKLPQKFDVILFDGHGYAHPRRFGAAMAIGVALNSPSIGIAKSPLVGGGDWKYMRRKAGNRLPVIHKGEKVGFVIVLLDKFPPVFVSAGYKIHLNTATKIALKTVRMHKQPECLGLAHNYLQSSKRKILMEHTSHSA